MSVQLELYLLDLTEMVWNVDDVQAFVYVN